MGNAIDHGPARGPIHIVVETSALACSVTITNQVAPRPCHRGLGLGTQIGERLAASVGATISSTAGSGIYSVSVAIPLRGVG
jgi:hypothetical protein